MNRISIIVPTRSRIQMVHTQSHCEIMKDHWPTWRQSSDLSAQISGQVVSQTFRRAVKFIGGSLLAGEGEREDEGDGFDLLIR